MGRNSLAKAKFHATRYACRASPRVTHVATELTPAASDDPHLRGDLDPLLADAARATWFHIGLFGAACLLLEFVVGRLANP
jgi:hypothetical protein